MAKYLLPIIFCKNTNEEYQDYDNNDKWSIAADNENVSQRDEIDDTESLIMPLVPSDFQRYKSD